MKVYIRSLIESDALFSFKWRNDPAVWELTRSRPDRHITQDMELEWIRRALNDQSTRRYAICVAGTDQYIGNVQLTGITSDEAEFHIFIGEKKYWGKGVSTQATALILNYAFTELNLKSIFLEVNKKNIAAVKSYKKNGFKIISISETCIKMKIDAPAI